MATYKVIVLHDINTISGYKQGLPNNVGDVTADDRTGFDNFSRFLDFKENEDCIIETNDHKRRRGEGDSSRDDVMLTLE